MAPKNNMITTQTTQTAAEAEAEALKSIGEASKKVNEALNYVNEYKRQGLQPNANDVMNLYKIVSDYERQISGFRRDPGDVGGKNNISKYIDIAARREDARENKRTVAKVISDSMEEIRLDAKKFKKSFGEKLTDSELKGKEAEELIDALSDYQKYDNGGEIHQGMYMNRADAKQRLLAACIGYVKNSKNKEAKTVVYDMAAIMGKQSLAAFDKLSDKDLSEMSTRRHIGYQHNTTGKVMTHSTCNTIPREGFVKNSDIVEKLSPDSTLTQEEKDAEYDKYMANIYASDRFAKFSKEERKQADKELGKNATEKERQLKLGEIAYKNAPWNKIKLDDTTKSKKAFTKRQKVMRQWFPDDSRYLYGPTTEKNDVKKFYSELDNGEYNGFVRSMKNSPEYTALINSLKKYTESTDIAKDEKNYKAVKDACEKYLDHYEQKKDKSEFAKMRAEKVKKLLDSLGGADKEVSKEASKADDAKKKVGTKTNFKELKEKDTTSKSKQTKKQDKTVQKSKSTSKSKY